MCMLIDIIISLVLDFSRWFAPSHAKLAAIVGRGALYAAHFNFVIIDQYLIDAGVFSAAQDITLLYLNVHWLHTGGGQYCYDGELHVPILAF